MRIRPKNPTRCVGHRFLRISLLFVSCILNCCFGAIAIAVEAPRGFAIETLATNLHAATALAPSRDGRVFISDQTGHVLVWKDPGKPLQRALSLHVTDYWERGLIGLCLAPDFPMTPHLFVLYVTDRPFVHHILSRFTIRGDVMDPASETILLEGDDQARLGGSVPAGHQGGALRFGHDGRLYVSLGEQTAGEPAQRLDTLQGKILRLNPDGSIPGDNPFFARTAGKYRAIYALGVRNSFGLAVQPREDGGRMFFTDVGGSAFEEVNELVAGANYGWPLAEGAATNRTFANPLYAYPPLVGQSIVGGVFLPRASRWPEKWRGRFFFADFMKHWIQALDPQAPTNGLTFARGLNGPVALELAPDSSLLVLNRGTIWRDPKKFVPNAGSLVRIRYVGESTVAGVATTAPAGSGFTPALGLPARASQLPRTLSRSDWEKGLRGARRWPFWLNNSAWHPFVSESIGLFLPTGSVVRLSGPANEIQLPPGAVVVRTFSVMDWPSPGQTKGEHPHDAAPHRIETRLLVAGAPRGYGASYRWRNPDTAELVEDGELQTFSNLWDVNSTNETPRRVSLPWWFPGVDEISFPMSNPAYWVSTAAEDLILPASPNHPAGPDFKPNWLTPMHRKGVLATTLSQDSLNGLPHGSSWINPAMSPEKRVRSYLHGNCASCHQPGGASRGSFDARITTPLAQAGLLNAEVAAGDLGIDGARIVVPGFPERSILYQRLKGTDFFRMPPVQYHNEPSPILPVMAEWIRSLPVRSQ